MAQLSGTILLVDGDEGFRYAAAESLEIAGFTVSTAPDCNEALDVLDSGLPVDLLVTDIYFPSKVHGFALARMARMRRLGLKVLYITAFDVPEAEAVGKILRKPLTNDQLVNEVRLALANESEDTINQALRGAPLPHE
jgi:DNA-binding NtrC family response regulator